MATKIHPVFVKKNGRALFYIGIQRYCVLNAIRGVGMYPIKCTLILSFIHHQILIYLYTHLKLFN